MRTRIPSRALSNTVIRGKVKWNTRPLPGLTPSFWWSIGGLGRFDRNLEEFPEFLLSESSLLDDCLQSAALNVHRMHRNRSHSTPIWTPQVEVASLLVVFVETSALKN